MYSNHYHDTLLDKGKENYLKFQFCFWIFNWVLYICILNLILYSNNFICVYFLWTRIWIVNECLRNNLFIYFFSPTYPWNWFHSITYANYTQTLGYTLPHSTLGSKSLIDRKLYFSRHNQKTTVQRYRKTLIFHWVHFS